MLKSRQVPIIDENQTLISKTLLATLVLALSLGLKAVDSSVLDRGKPVEQLQYSDNIHLHVEHFNQAVKLFHWLDQIQLTESGAETLRAIKTSGHQLVIYHSESALLSAGVTGAPLSINLTNGRGEDAYIKFYLNMDTQGSNCVLGKRGQYIEYTALQNLFHELSHARHKMKGTWLYFDSEGQAIRDENQFRAEWGQFRFKTFASRYEDAEDEDIVRAVAGKCHQNQTS